MGLDYTDNKFVVKQDSTALTPAATVSVNFTSTDINTLTLNTDTTINISGTPYNGDVKYLEVTGDFLLKFVQATYTFRGDVDGAGVLTSYDGLTTNLVAIKCINAASKIFWVLLKKDA